MLGLDEPQRVTDGGGSGGDTQGPTVDGRPDVPPACSNGSQDNLETDIDCGPGCDPCGAGKKCTMGTDCAVASCINSVCRLPYDCNELHQLQPALGDGAYAIDIGGTTGAVTTYCDMTTDGGGWTLVGKVDGRHDMANTWLVSSQNVASLTTAAISENTFSCVDAVALAVGRASQVRISNATRDRWIRWPLPAGRTLATFWRQSSGHNAIENAGTSGVTVMRWSGQMNNCQQNVYGINPFVNHGGGYPYTAYNGVGNTQPNDGCVTVGVSTVSINGFTQNGNGFDAPEADNDWPNGELNRPPHLAVWLR